MDKRPWKLRPSLFLTWQISETTDASDYSESSMSLIANLMLQMLRNIHPPIAASSSSMSSFMKQLILALAIKVLFQLAYFKFYLRHQMNLWSSEINPTRLLEFLCTLILLELQFDCQSCPSCSDTIDTTKRWGR